MKQAALLLIYLVVVLLPLALSWIVGGPPRAFHQELATGLGMLAFAMILAEFVLSGRFRSVSGGIGMDVTMRFHQIMARTALIFALLHPLLYQGTPSGDQRPWDATRQLTLVDGFPPLATGILAYLLLAALVALAMFRTQLDYKYETWRLMHGIGALLIAGLLLHHTLHAGRYSAAPELTWLWSGMTALAVGSLLYVYLIEPMRQSGKKWRVASIRRLTPRQWGLTLTPEGHSGLSYKAGQFAWLNIGHSPFSLQEHPFSICSAPASGADISFVIKELGDFTGTLDRIAPGTRAYVDGSYGSLLVDGRTEPGIALIAGGIGIAPLIGILRQLRLTDDPRKVRLIYGNRAEEQILFREELGTEDVIHVLSEPPPAWSGEAGFIDSAVLDRAFTPEEFREWVFVLCGPEVMMNAVETLLIAKGTPSSRILSERFDYD